MSVSPTEIKSAKVVIACAGMEGALPTVLAGLIPQPIIGLPVSVGYGISGGGSGGTAGNSSYGTWTETSANFGGGCGAGSGGAGRGAVRIIWPGDERYFPNTNTADV